MKKKLIILTIFIALLIIGITAFLIAGSESRTVKKQLNLGQKYLIEQDYDQAIIAFSAVIEIDAANAEAYIGIADAYIGKGDYDTAFEYIDLGISATDSDALKAKRAELEALEQAQKEAEKKAEEEALNKKRAQLIEADLDWLFETGFTILGDRWDGHTPLNSYIQKYKYINDSIDSDDNPLKFVRIHDGVAMQTADFDKTFIGDGELSARYFSAGFDSPRDNYNYSYLYNKVTEPTNRISMYQNLSWNEYPDKKSMTASEGLHSLENSEWGRFLKENDLLSPEDFRERWQCPETDKEYILQSDKYGQLIVTQDEETLIIQIENQQFDSGTNASLHIYKSESSEEKWTSGEIYDYEILIAIYIEESPEASSASE